MLSVEVTISANEYIGTIERMAAMHTKNCLLDNPDIDGCTIQDVDVAINGSEETDPIF